MIEDVIRQLSESIEEAHIQLMDTPFSPLKGRNTDGRQQLPGLMDFKSPYTKVSNHRWLVEFAKDEYPHDMVYMGPVPLALVGHYDMLPDEFRYFLKDVHSQAYPRQTSEPVIATKSGARVDVRRMIRGGDYEPGLRLLCPAALRALESIVKMVDDIQAHPLSHQGLRRLKRMGPMSVSDLASKLKDLSGTLIEPGHNKGTLGDVMNNVAYPFMTGGIFN
jgi:hypothetical protein